MSLLSTLTPVLICVSSLILDASLYVAYGGIILLIMMCLCAVSLVASTYFVISTIMIQKDIERLKRRGY